MLLQTVFAYRILYANAPTCEVWRWPAVRGGLVPCSLFALSSIIRFAMPEADLSYDAIELGKPYGPYKYPLSERIARILEATENAHPWHHGRSPWGPPVAPPSILGSICMRFSDWIAPISPGTLHARQDVRTDAALRLDRQPIAYGTFVEKYERRRRRWAVFETRFRDETGLIMGHGRTTLAFPELIETVDESPEKADPGQ